MQSAEPSGIAARTLWASPTYSVVAGSLMWVVAITFPSPATTAPVTVCACLAVVSLVLSRAFTCRRARRMRRDNRMRQLLIVTARGGAGPPPAPADLDGAAGAGVLGEMAVQGRAAHAAGAHQLRDVSPVVGRHAQCEPQRLLGARWPVASRRTGRHGNLAIGAPVLAVWVSAARPGPWPSGSAAGSRRSR